MRVFYGHKNSGASWHQTLSVTIKHDLKYISSKGDPDVCMKPKTKENGDQCYSYLISYVDDILCFDIDPMVAFKILDGIHPFKDKVEFPKMFGGADLREWESVDFKGNVIDFIAYCISI